MPIAIQHQSCKPNATVTFDFHDNVLAHVVGVGYWKFAFAKDDHHVRRLALAVDANKTAPGQVTARVTATLDDDSGHGIDPNGSSVMVSCIAVVTASDSNIVLADVKPGTGSDSATLTNSAAAIGSAFLSGMSLTQPRDHHVMRLEATVGVRQNGNQAQATGQASLCDASGNVSDGAIAAGMVVTTPTERGILSRSVCDRQTGENETVVVDFGVPLAKEAAVMLQSLVVAFNGNDHHVLTIGAGCTNWKAEGTKLTLDNARAFITDDTSHVQDNGESRVSLVVFALPSGQAAA